MDSIFCRQVLLSRRQLLQVGLYLFTDGKEFPAVQVVLLPICFTREGHHVHLKKPSPTLKELGVRLIPTKVFEYNFNSLRGV